MSEPPKDGGSGAKATPEPSVAKPSPTPASATKPKSQNPAFRALGLPNWRLRLPSRNWTIFLTIVGSWTAALVYDRRQKKKIQQKWCKLVEHIAQEPLGTNDLPRRLTIYLEAPPGDGLTPARDYFRDYVKPILVAGAVDWDVIEGRREGQLRAGLAEKIRRMRRRSGEVVEKLPEDDTPIQLEMIRDRLGNADWEAQRGGIVIGRHAWKEYIRGLHEGWLGPLDAPAPPQEEEPQLTSEVPTVKLGNDPGMGSPTNEGEQSELGDASPSTAQRPENEDPKKAEDKLEEKKPEKPNTTPAYISTDTYSSATPPRSIPDHFNSAPIAFPHILGFLNTPKRLYRFLTRRYVADDVGRQVAAAVLLHSRPYESEEVQQVLLREEADWKRKLKQRKNDEGERVWLDDIVLDSRILERMRRYVIDTDEERRVETVVFEAGAVKTSE